MPRSVAACGGSVMHPGLERLQFVTRRHFIKESAAGLGAVALAAISARDAGAAPTASVNPLAPRQPPFKAKAKRMIYLHMSGAPPHFDLFDYKPELVKHTGKNCPDQYLKGKRFAFTSGVPKLLGPPRKFS